MIVCDGGMVGVEEHCESKEKTEAGWAKEGGYTVEKT